MAGRPSTERISETEFSDLLGTLSATSKGRAFLDEYRRRARPDETASLLDSLQRIEATIGTVRDQLQPERIAHELRRIAMTLEIAVEGASAETTTEEYVRRIALVERGRAELVALASGLGGSEGEFAADQVEEVLETSPER